MAANGGGLFKNLPKEITVWHSHFDEVKELPEGFQVGSLGVSGNMGMRRPGYMGPCPPTGAHHYHFQVLAFDRMLDVYSHSPDNKIVHIAIISSMQDQRDRPRQQLGTAQMPRRECESERNRDA